jgi:hypothetical protein
MAAKQLLGLRIDAWRAVRARRRVSAAAVLLFAAAALTGPASASDEGGGGFRPGEPGLNDPYFPLDGNGGYDVEHYLLDLAYDPATDLLSGTATITARATQNLSAFNLDLDGLTVRSVEVNNGSASWSRDGGELTVTPKRGLPKGHRFTAEVKYDGVPEAVSDQFGTSGFLHTDDGALVVGEPHVAATWFPVNDHPLDKASYTFRITVPEGLEVVANGRLQSRKTRNGKTTWAWRAAEPMASYLATASVGDFRFDTSRDGRIRILDALDPDLFDPPALPHSGASFAWSQAGNASYKRLARTLSVPAGGAALSFWVDRDTEQDWDFMFVEARTAGADDWTTLQDANGHTSAATGSSCPAWHEVHPFLAHYQTDAGGGPCTPSGTSGQWWAASGASDGWEQWAVDLSAYAGRDVELAISYASDIAVQGAGVFIDDIAVSTGEGSTSFEVDGDTLDGWRAAGAPAGSMENANDWIATAKPPATLGEQTRAVLDRQPEILGFLAKNFGPYPFRDAGAIVDDYAGLGFALENQTRPIYNKEIFGDPVLGTSTVVHELAHQWFGDSLTIDSWRDIWLNEGFATYAELLWNEREGLETAQEFFDRWAATPAGDELWSVMVGDPGADLIFDSAIYIRGAMTLHALRVQVGDKDFLRILRAWAKRYAGTNVSTAEFTALAERISGDELDPLFDEWLFTAQKPAGLPESKAADRSMPNLRQLPPGVRSPKQRPARPASR